MQHAIERQARLGLLLALSAAACTSSNASGGPSDSSADITALLADASGDGPCTSTASILASSFDQSCVSDLDCVPVGQGSVCAECGFVCPSAAINNGALAAYQAAAVDGAGPLHHRSIRQSTRPRMRCRLASASSRFMLRLASATATALLGTRIVTPRTAGCRQCGT